MRTTINIDDDLFRKAQEETGLKTKKEVIEHGLKLILQHAAAEYLASLRGKVPDAWAAPRRRPGSKK